jgi:hypothetical protein
MVTAVHERYVEAHRKARRLRVELQKLLPEAEGISGRFGIKQLAIAILSGRMEDKMPISKKIARLLEAITKDSAQSALDSLCHSCGFSADFISRLVKAKAIMMRLEAAQLECDATNFDRTAELLEGLNVREIDPGKLEYIKNLIITYLAKLSMDLEIGEDPMLRRKKDAQLTQEERAACSSGEMVNPSSIGFLEDKGMVETLLGINTSEEPFLSSDHSGNVLAFLSEEFDNISCRLMVDELLKPALTQWYNAFPEKLAFAKELNFKIEALRGLIENANEDPALKLKGMVNSAIREISILCEFYVSEKTGEQK